MNKQTIVIGGGCFWCTESVFLEVDGVLAVRSGYSGGAVENPSYEAVCTGTTGHAEVIEVSYDADQISLDKLLLIHLITHNPTTLNRQGADVGTQYRSVIFYANKDEQETAQRVIDEVQASYSDKIVTTLEPLEIFYEAEQDHQNFYKNNPYYGYCQAVIEPKLARFRRIYQDLKKVE